MQKLYINNRNRLLKNSHGFLKVVSYNFLQDLHCEIKHFQFTIWHSA